MFSRLCNCRHFFLLGITIRHGSLMDGEEEEEAMNR